MWILKDVLKLPNPDLRLCARKPHSFEFCEAVSRQTPKDVVGPRACIYIFITTCVFDFWRDFWNVFLSLTVLLRFLKMCLKLHVLLFVSVWGAIVLCVTCFNLENRDPVIKSGIPGTYFGYAVAQHKMYNNSRVGDNW